MMVLDVGAGTSDFSLFWVVQNFDVKGHIAFPVHPAGRAIRMAGDTLDSLLVSELLGRAHLGADDDLRRRVSSALFLSGVRRLKEQLFTTGKLQHRLVNDQEVSITMEEFLITEGVSKFKRSIDAALQDFLNSVHESWLKPMESIQLVLTGGGCDLPMVKDLAKKAWRFKGQTVRFRLVDLVPQFIKDNFAADIVKEYPQLSVALGGALPMVLDERSTLSEWGGGTLPPGPLTKYQVTGI
jgi:molecular chaperone HscA